MTEPCGKCPVCLSDCADIVPCMALSDAEVIKSGPVPDRGTGKIGPCTADSKDERS